jgi:hypothetical protein
MGVSIQSVLICARQDLNRYMQATAVRPLFNFFFLKWVKGERRFYFALLSAVVDIVVTAVDTLYCVGQRYKRPAPEREKAGKPMRRSALAPLLHHFSRIPALFLCVVPPIPISPTDKEKKGNHEIRRQHTKKKRRATQHTNTHKNTRERARSTASPPPSPLSPGAQLPSHGLTTTTPTPLYPQKSRKLLKKKEGAARAQRNCTWLPSGKSTKERIDVLCTRMWEQGERE